MTLKQLDAVWAPRILSIMRIVAGLLFMEHGMQKLLHFPPGGPPSLTPLLTVAALLEIIGGILVLIGLFTRPAAFILSGQMAVAYFLAHAPRALYPVVNGGDAAILFCFVFLYLAFAGGGAWSADRAMRLRWA